MLSASIGNVKATTDSTKILFIGNSITYYNSMPYTFRDIANNKGKNVSVQKHTVGGAGFINHYTDPNLYAVLRSTVWDIVIMQPSSGESLGMTSKVDSTIYRGRIIMDSIYKYSPCAKIYLYQVPNMVIDSLSYPYYFINQTKIRDSVAKMADSLKLQIVPAGECYRAYYTAHHDLLLHVGYYNVHPSPFGSFLIASAFYASIFQDSTAGCQYHSTIQTDTSHVFFSIADSVVLNYITNWRINTFNLHPDFSFTVVADTVHFVNLSSNFTNLVWNFGDNHSSNSANPSHSYLYNGTYNVKLYAYNGTCVDSMTRQVTINVAGLSINENSYNEFAVYPNPAQSNLYLKGVGVNSKIAITDIFGQTLFLSNVGTEEVSQINIADLNKGVYFLCIADQKDLKKVIKFIKS